MTPIEKLEKLLAEATPGPWSIWREQVPDKSAAIAELTAQVDATEPFVGELFLLNANGKCPATTGCGPTSEANARLIVELRNNAEALLTALRTQGEQGWQDIATAPKDGTRVIVSKFAWVHTAVEDIFKEDAPKIWHLCFATTAHFLSDRGYWTDGLERLVEPTHWMPLPTPPVLES